MKNIYNKFHINSYTYVFLFLCALSGYLKNMFLIFIICFIHELGHIFFTKLFGYEIIKVEILPFGGFTTINKRINSSIRKDLIISIGGILSQLLFITIIFFCQSLIHPITYNLLMQYNFLLIIFNLIPIIPLDGNQIVHLFLEKLFSYHQAYLINAILSIITLIIFFLINYYYHLDNYFIITFLIYKIISYFHNYKYLHNRFLLERCLYNLEYKKIDNHTTNIKNLKKEVYHYFKEDDHYINEKNKILQTYNK